MCRLYAMHANEPTRVECGLVRSQNALMAQSLSDREGMMHGHGWGVADYPEGLPIIEKQTWAAFHGERFAKKAARVYARTVVAHVRRATVGAQALENTHPFHHGVWIFAHNGTIPNFGRVRMAMLEAMDPLHRVEIDGETDSEHIFRYLLSLLLRHPERGLLENVQAGLNDVIAWSRVVDPGARVGLNVVLTDGRRMVASRLNRSLYRLRRDRVFDCPICRKPHVHHKAATDYRAVEIASEPITQHDVWTEVPNGCVFQVTEDYGIESLPLGA
ncbi:class II glutamine amidotransferase [Jannaschia ovalis]|uniref:Class II glutamine amidotransferase n=1 Tax=Jannaschia ovalis TaxID=3038773 RepID=A0ABY8L7A9_9RHOB|nr:class II glutamine amidotransferase [Jannaschia sp. GRR-S6-38]WGH77181.1 class II glutamine amidotransferase [Jannaschia sp. GRR-S6-38]